MKRRTFLRLISGGAVGAGLTTGIETRGAPAGGERRLQFELEEASLADLQMAMATGRRTAVSIARSYLRRIRELDQRGPALRAVLELNPDALKIAAGLDRERAAGRTRGPMHGVPVLIKDNIDTHDRMTTTAGSLALEGSAPQRDAFVVERLRAAGAVILGKTNLSEWANFRGDRSTSGWSGRGGQTRNPYVLDRNPSGSSSGSAVAVSANLCGAAVGTETDGSILSPAAHCGIVGLKPTLGLVSRSGIIPIAASQDTAGPMARTVRDAAVLLGAMIGVDDRDESTMDSVGRVHPDYTRFLDAGGLNGSRIGVLRSTFGGHPAVAPMMEKVLAGMRGRGAVLVDPVTLPNRSAYGAAEFEVMLFEFKAGLNDYLAGLGSGARVRTLEDVIRFNEANRDRELQWFGQETLVRAQTKGPLTEAAYLDARATCRRVSRREGIDAVMTENRLDALLAASGGPAGAVDYAHGDRSVGGGGTSIAAVAGYPSITLPAGTAFGLPMGISLMAGAWMEPELLRIASGLEDLLQGRRVPRFLSALSGSVDAA